jgi:hypothetical protein
LRERVGRSAHRRKDAVCEATRARKKRLSDSHESESIFSFCNGYVTIFFSRSRLYEGAVEANSEPSL